MPQIVLLAPGRRCYWSYFIVSTVLGVYAKNVLALSHALITKCLPVSVQPGYQDTNACVCVLVCVCSASQIKLKPLKVAISDTASWLEDMSIPCNNRSSNYN